MKENFYQSKYEYYKKSLVILCIVSSLAQIGYFISDCHVYGEIFYKTLIPRFSILIPLAIFLIISKKTNNYRTVIISAYVVLHSVMWCTIWAISYLPTQTYAREGFIIMNIMFMVAGLAAPKKMSTIAHSIVIFNIIISNMFHHYEHFTQMILLSVPCYIAIQSVIWTLEKGYEEHYELLKQLEHLSKVDQLTGIYNRHKIKDLILNNSNKLINENNKEIAIAIIDIDYFKKINDTYGHNKGDKVIVDSVDIIKKSIFNRDCMIRWGGEEFLVIFYNCDITMAERKCEIIRKLIEDSDNGVCKSTVSIGLAKYDNKNYKESIEHADKALYEAKDKGRNQVIVYNKLTA
jgi:diguanylate cyclase (GGDEF)-like protein